MDLHVGVRYGFDLGPLRMLPDDKWLAASDVMVVNNEDQSFARDE